MGETIEVIQELALLYGVKVITALAIFIVGRWAAKKNLYDSTKIVAKNNVDPATEHFVGSLVSWTLLIFVVIAALGQLGIQTASFVAIVGAAGLAVGLGSLVGLGTVGEFSLGSLVTAVVGALVLLFAYRACSK
ncbi:GlsB/YeaQ/YmgE family stress response membrane protein [bacterium]|nr:GlsB/YeaQ/YmgE family stress response membrane protein [bacterium]